MFDQTIWQECPTASARYESHSIEVSKSFFVELVNIDSSTLHTSDHPVEILGWLRHRTLFSERFLGLNLLLELPDFIADIQRDISFLRLFAQFLEAALQVDVRFFEIQQVLHPAERLTARAGFAIGNSSQVSQSSNITSAPSLWPR